MLNFWYSERCSRQIKLIVCIATCVMIFMAAQVQQLGAIFIGLSLVIGIATHLLRGVQLKIAQDNPYRRLFAFGYFSAPNCPDLFAGLFTRAR